MRLQLVCFLLVAGSATAAADGQVSVRGVYYKERATRVMQPMLDGVFEVAERGLLSTHFLVDAITSASASAGAADAVPFTETRYEGGVGYTHQGTGWKLGADGKYSSESDYKSIYIGARGELELNQKNTLLGLGGGVGYDTISAGSGGGLGQPTIECEPGGIAQSECNLSTLSVFVSASQIFNRNAVGGVSIDVARLNGYQSNPYRSAIGGDELVAERHPTLRTREAFAGWLRYYVPRTQTTLIGSYRFYRDTWKVHGHTPEIRIVQLIEKVADASFRYRWHTQDAAFFFRDRYATADGICMEPGNLTTRYLSDDVKLSNMSTHTIEAKLGIAGAAFDLQGKWAGARFEGVLQYVVQYNRFGNAIVAHLGLTVPFGY